jgi:hypothetical protein
MVVEQMPVETASEMTSFRRVRLGTGTITRTRGQMTDYMDRYMAPRRREWAVRREGRIPTQLHWILSEACAAFASEGGIALGGTSRLAPRRRTALGPMRDCPGLAQQTIVVEAVGPAEPLQGIDVCRCSNYQAGESEWTKGRQLTPIGRVVNAAHSLTALCFLPSRANELHAPSLRPIFGHSPRPSSGGPSCI